MNMTQANKFVIGTAMFGGLVAAGGFLWVDSVDAAR
ncbi:MAG: hypothetical protein QOI14_485, partial [Actinomycetota bacterium]|nr:hypothetical protein [Actinomycetota bacterium]